MERLQTYSDPPHSAALCRQNMTIPSEGPPYLGRSVSVVGVFRWFVSLLAAVVALAIVPRTVVARDAGAVFRNDLSVLSDRADNVAHSITSGVRMKDFSTGSDRFDGEWVLGTHQMASLGNVPSRQRGVYRGNRDLGTATGLIDRPSLRNGPRNSNAAMWSRPAGSSGRPRTHLVTELPADREPRFRRTSSGSLTALFQRSYFVRLSTTRSWKCSEWQRSENIRTGSLEPVISTPVR